MSLFRVFPIVECWEREGLDTLPSGWFGTFHRECEQLRDLLVTHFKIPPNDEEIHTIQMYRMKKLLREESFSPKLFASDEVVFALAANFIFDHEMQIYHQNGWKPTFTTKARIVYFCRGMLQCSSLIDGYDSKGRDEWGRPRGHS